MLTLHVAWHEPPERIAADVKRRLACFNAAK
jgi:hypothetical protein